jgi:hypothetical protein
VAVVEDGLFVANRRHIAELAIKNRLPSLGFREYCEAGGLAAYGVDFPHIWRGAGAIVDKVLKGRNPADLPIEQASRFEFILNLKTAKTLGFNVPPPMSARANQVTNEQLSSCRREIADPFGRVKAGASRPRAARGYGLDSAKSISATATVRSSRCSDH